MWTKKIVYIFFLAFFPLSFTYSQAGTFHFNFEGSGGYTSPGVIPFWFRSLKSGSVPGGGFSADLVGSVYKDYRSEHIFNWGAGLKTRFNAKTYPEMELIEGYLKAKVSIFEIKAGRSQEIMGLCDTTFTSGSFSISGNAPGIPSVQIGTPEFVSFPFFQKLISIKLNYSHGWLGNTPTNLNGTSGIQKTFFHQKSMYLRFGKPDRRFNFYTGFNHQVFWGNEKGIFGKDFTLSPIETYFYVLTGKDYSTDSIEPSRIGNHLGSVDLGAKYEFDNFRLFIYRQNFYDFVALKYLANISDGLNGLSLVNKNTGSKIIGFRKFLVEFLYSKDQGKRHYNEDYYNNYIYPDGWSYKNFNLGNPLLTPKTFIRKGLSDKDNDYYHNNRVAAIHGGIEGNILDWRISVKTTWSRNFGTYYFPLKNSVDQFSGWIELNRGIRNINFGLRAAVDKGDLLYDSQGLIFFLSGHFDKVAK